LIYPAVEQAEGSSAFVDLIRFHDVIDPQLLVIAHGPAPIVCATRHLLTWWLNDIRQSLPCWCEIDFPSPYRDGLSAGLVIPVAGAGCSFAPTTIAACTIGSTIDGCKYEYMGGAEADRSTSTGDIAASYVTGGTLCRDGSTFAFQAMETFTSAGGSGKFASITSEGTATVSGWFNQQCNWNGNNKLTTPVERRWTLVSSPLCEVAPLRRASQITEDRDHAEGLSDLRTEWLPSNVN
jgi:hypothetical protein